MVGSVEQARWHEGDRRRRERKQVPPANGAMRGTPPPEIFNGDRNNPFSRVAMALSCMKGLNVDDWVKKMTKRTGKCM